MRRLNPTAIALIAGVLLLLLLVFVFARGGDENQDKLGDDQVAGGSASADDPEKQCAGQRTYDLIKRELFRRAAQVRGSAQGAFDKLAAYSSLRMDAPALQSHDEDVGRVSCTASASLDLPPGVAVVGGRRTLAADISYTLQPAADGTGTVLTLANADAIVTPLATLARTNGGQPAQPAAPSDPLAPIEPAAPGAPATPAAPAPATPAPPSQPAQPAAANPSFNCGNARTRGEIAVCNDAGLASLDRQMAAQFNSAMSRADAGERALLQRTRGSFLAFRDRCRSDSCIADTYRGRMREIADIMAGRWSPQR